MIAPLNGHRTPDSPADPDPAGDIAKGLYDSQFEDGDTAWADLPNDARSEVTEYVKIALGLHVAWLTARGFKIVPPGAAVIPTSQEEALAMVQAAKGFFDAQKRRGGLLSGAASKKVILPKGSKLQ